MPTRPLHTHCPRSAIACCRKLDSANFPQPFTPSWVGSTVTLLFLNSTSLFAWPPVPRSVPCSSLTPSPISQALGTSLLGDVSCLRGPLYAALQLGSLFALLCGRLSEPHSCKLPLFHSHVSSLYDARPSSVQDLYSRRFCILRGKQRHYSEQCGTMINQAARARAAYGR